MRNCLTRVTIEISESQKKQLKVLAALHNMTLKDLIIDKTIGLEPNQETVQAFDDYQNKTALTKHANFDDFWNDVKK